MYCFPIERRYTFAQPGAAGILRRAADRSVRCYTHQNAVVIEWSVEQPDSALVSMRGCCQGVFAQVESTLERVIPAGQGSGLRHL